MKETPKEEKVPKYLQNPPDWCDDCVVQDGPCPDCGCTHNC